MVTEFRLGDRKPAKLSLSAYKKTQSVSSNELSDRRAGCKRTARVAMGGIYLGISDLQMAVRQQHPSLLHCGAGSSANVE
jgi:hypothetical protein